MDLTALAPSDGIVLGHQIKPKKHKLGDTASPQESLGDSFCI